MRVGSCLVVFAGLWAQLYYAASLHAQPLVNIETVMVGDAGNAADTNGYGRVTNVFAIGKFEVTIGQYAVFLNSVARTNTNSYVLDLWRVGLAIDLNVAGISRSGSGNESNPYSYSIIGSSNRPITYVSWFDAARFANWMHNGATNGASTETGAYTLNGATSGVITKNAGAAWWIPNEDEWYKTAYYRGGNTNAGYWVYPTKSDTAPGNTIGGATNQANYYAGDYAVTQSASYSGAQNYLTEAGVFSNSPSSYAAFDQGGNVSEWNDSVSGSSRSLRGGSWASSGAGALQSSNRVSVDPASEFTDAGFRLAGRASNAIVLPRISSATYGSNGFFMTWTPASDVNVQRCLHLGANVWTTVLSNATGTNYLDPATPLGRGFYRLVLP